jgi:hypothetical protein
MNRLRKAPARQHWLRSPLRFSGVVSASRGSDTPMMRVRPQPTRRHGDGHRRGVPTRAELQLGMASWSPCHRFAASN